MPFTNEGIRDITVSAGQLSGVDPETGLMIIFFLMTPTGCSGFSSYTFFEPDTRQATD